MQTVAFRVPDRDLPAFLKLVKSIPTVQRIEMPTGIEHEQDDEDRPPTKEEILEDIRQGLLDIRRAEKTGETIGRPLADVLRELREEGL